MITSLPRILGLASVALALISPAPGQQDAPPNDGADRFAQLATALGEKKRTLLSEARAALELVRGYEEFLDDPDTSYDERAEIRENLIRERSRYRRIHGQAVHVQSTIRQLRSVPDQSLVALPALKEAYEGLDKLGDRGKTAWGQLLRDRESALTMLKENHAADLAEATRAYEDLDTTARARQLLLDAIDSDRSDSTDAAFRDALKLPRVVSAVRLGFGLKDASESPEIEAQIVLVALADSHCSP